MKKIVFIFVGLLATAVIATLVIELPFAVLARMGRRDPLEGALASVRGRLAGQVGSRAVGGVQPPLASPAPAAHTRAREDHGRIVTPPTVVRRH